MQRNSPEAAQRNISWSQLKELLAETAPPTSQELSSEFQPKRKVGSPAASPVQTNGMGAHQLIDEAVSVVRQASEEAVRIRSEAAEKNRRNQVEISELSRILKLTEQQLSAFEARHDEAIRESQRYQAQIAELERTRIELDRQIDNDKRIISTMERMLDDTKARLVTVEERARVAEESSKALELQLRTLVGTMRQKLLSVEEPMFAARETAEPVSQPPPVSLIVPMADPDGYDEEPRVAGRGLGTIALAVGSAALAASFLVLNPAQEAKANDAGWLQGIWGASCDAPWLIVDDSRFVLQTGSEGVITGDFPDGSGAVRLLTDEGPSNVEIELISRGENVIVMRKTIRETGTEPEQSLLIRCSLAPAAPSAPTV